MARTITDIANEIAKALESEVGPGVPFKVRNPAHCCSMVLASKPEVELVYEFYHNALPRSRYEKMASAVRLWYQTFSRTKSTALRRPLEQALKAYSHPCPFLDLDKGECVLGSLRPLACHKSDKSGDGDDSGILGKRGFFVVMLAERLRIRIDAHPTLMGSADRFSGLEMQSRLRKYFTYRAKMSRGRLPSSSGGRS